MAGLCLLMITLLYAQKEVYTLSGYVSDLQSGEKLINANVYDPVTLQGTVSNVYGFYSLSLPKGNYQITFSYVGFANQVVKVDLSKDQVLNINLDSSESIDEVTVVGSATNNKLQETQMSKEILTMETVKSLPAFMGEVDIIKTLQLLPGIQSGAEGSSGLYVRGGGPDQNLILLDGVPVYNANHLFGFFSVFNADAIKNVTLYKGGFPARFGGRLSSVLDIRMKEGNEKEIHGGVQVGLISSKFNLEGPIEPGKTAFHISGRRTYIDALTRPLMPKEEKGGYYFYDLNAKINHKFSDKDRLYLSAYAGRDKAFFTYDFDNAYYNSTTNEESDMKWGNITTALRWNHIFNNKLFCNTTLTYSKYEFLVDFDFEEYQDKILQDRSKYRYSSGINDMSAKLEFDWYPNTSNSIKFGFGYTYHDFEPGVEAFTDWDEGSSKVDKNGDPNVHANEFSTYIEDDLKITSRLKANLGLHLSGFNVENKFYSSFEPRLSLRYIASDKITLKTAYTKMQQYLHLLSNSTIGLPTDLWLPATGRVKPQVSDQYALGMVYSPKKGYTFSLEGFYKDMENVIAYKEGASFSGVATNWEDKVEVGTGRSYGMELLLKKELGKNTGWIGYTLSRTERKFDNLNYGDWFPATYDRTHDISATYSYKVSDKFDMGLVWVYGTGNAFTLPTHRIESLEFSNNNWYYDNTVPYFEKRNDYRMPDYHRMDVSFNFHKQKKHGVRTWSVSVYNLYNRKNAFFLYPDGEYLKQISLFPILPSISYSFKF